MKNIKRPELLSPAGNLEKLRFAVDYGADAVYCALDRFGMRAQADNFSPEDMANGIEYAHQRGKKVYVTLNVMPRDRDFEELPSYLGLLGELKPDAYIISDPGVMEYAKRYIKNPVIHLSTQTSTVNSATVSFWQKQGVSRVVLARELSLSEIAAIAKNVPGMEIECFVHGAMCVSYSGRCLLSNYYTGRNANEGKCAQPCRWKYYLSEEKRGETAVVEQDCEGTYIFSSRDMRMIEHIDDLVNAGIDSFKIEGRMKSAYYTAAVTNAYRIAIDNYFEGKPYDVRLARETESMSHREFGTGYYYSSPSDDANVSKVNEYINDVPFLCTVSEFDAERGLAKCIQRNKMCVGDEANILSPGTFGRDIVIGKMYDSEMNPIEDTRHPMMEFYLETEFAKSGDIIRGKL